MGTIIHDPSCIKCALLEIEQMKSASEVEVACHPEGGLCFSCNDASLSYDAYLDNQPSILNEFFCKEEKAWKFNRNLILRAGRPLNYANKLFMRMNANGIICIQHLINDDDENPLFIDCFIQPLEIL